MKKQELQNKLNIEYKGTGLITIRVLHEEIVDVSKIIYVKSIMNEIEPLDSDEPVVLAPSYARDDWGDKYKIIDGYHRVKNKLVNGETNINAIVLDSYDIQRPDDTFLDFIKGQVGKEITFVDNNFLKADGRYYEIVKNEGYGACSSGWSDLNILKEYINKPINVNEVHQLPDDHDGDLYKLVINGKVVAEVDTGWGNGYYGGDFEISLIT